MNEIVAEVKRGWIAHDLPRYRDHPQPATYSLFSYDDLPDIQITSETDWQWLDSSPNQEGSLAESGYSDGSKPDLGKLSKIAAQVGFQLPISFEQFISTPAWHQKIRSCTDCYLDLADRAIKVIDADDGYLIHFLSDSQWCCHWYILVKASGDHDIYTSFDAYGFNVEEASDDDDDEYATCRKDAIKLMDEPLWFCAATFTEFIYRFWLENEIWFALSFDEQPLTAEQKTYLAHYQEGKL
ncbi:MAG: hypothetical protein JNJ50_01695 [Acidobacteria bacterium]|nr:hypothetical protein [Acidobacteriota bacterium]